MSLQRLGHAGPLLERAVRQWQDGRITERTEPLIEETPVVLVYNQLPHVVMMATPQDLEDFILGFSLTEELIGTPSDLESVEVVRYSQGIELQASVPAACQRVIESRTRRLTGRTGCGICGSDSIEAVLKSIRPVATGGRFSATAIQRAVAALGDRQPLNQAAGSVHAAAWAAEDGTIELVREDVGRHNALDKLIGALVRRGTDPGSGFVVITSRASFEMAQKTTAFGAGVLVAVSGPTALAVRLADEAGLTLIGYARPGRFTGYTHAERVAGEV